MAKFASDIKVAFTEQFLGGTVAVFEYDKKSDSATIFVITENGTKAIRFSVDIGGSLMAEIE